MLQTTPDGLRFPEDTDTPDIPRDIKNLADDTQAALTRTAATNLRGGVPKFASYAERDAFYVANGAPVEGELCYLVDRDIYMYYQNATVGWVWSYQIGVQRGTYNLVANTRYVVSYDSTETASTLEVTAIPWAAGTTITVPRKGTYAIDFSFAVDPTTDTGISLEIMLNGVNRAMEGMRFIKGSFGPSVVARPFTILAAQGNTISTSITSTTACPLQRAVLRVTQIAF